MSFAQGIAGAGVALVIIAGWLFWEAGQVVWPKSTKAESFESSRDHWRWLLTWSVASLIAGGFLIGLGAVG